MSQKKQLFSFLSIINLFNDIVNDNDEKDKGIVLKYLMEELYAYLHVRKHLSNLERSQISISEVEIRDYMKIFL